MAVFWGERDHGEPPASEENAVLGVVGRLLQHEGTLNYERRNDPRIMALERASVHGIRANAIYAAMIIDVTLRGMSLSTHQRLPVGSTVIVRWCSGFVPCTVRHCRLERGAWIVGAEVKQLLPSVVRLLADLKEAAHRRNRSLHMAARICT